MIQNALKEKWARGEQTLNGWLSIGNSFTAEIMASANFDSVTVDWQHGALDYSDLLPMFQALRASGSVPMARVPWLEPGAIMKALDAGAYGIICPMVNSAAEAAELARHMRYPPDGVRSFGPTRANFTAGANYASEANDEIVCFAMVETAEAVRNLEEIAATPGVDGLYIGPADLTLGVANGALPPGFDREEPEMIEVIQKIARAAKNNGKVAALHCGAPSYAARALDWGFDMVTLMNDVRLLATAAEKTVSDMRALMGGSGGEAGSDASGY